MKLSSAISFIVALTLCLCLLAGCGFVKIEFPSDDSQAETTAETTAVETTDVGSSPESTAPKVPSKLVYPDRLPIAEKRLEALPDIEFNGESVIITGYFELCSVIEPSEDDLLNAARLRRNKNVEKKYNIGITVVNARSEEFYSSLIAAVRAGDYYTDLTLTPASDSVLFYISGASMNLRKLPFFKAEDCCFGEKTADGYFYSGAATSCPDLAWGLFYKRNAKSEKAFENIYRSLAKGNEVGWNDFFVALAEASFDADGGHMPLIACGSGTEDIYRMSDIVLSSLGSQFVFLKNGEYLKYSSDEIIINEASAVLDSLSKLVFVPKEVLPVESEVQTASETTAQLPGGASNETAPFEPFDMDEVGFCFLRLGKMRELAAEKTEWGILPIPGKDNLAVYDEGRPVITVVQSTSRPELCGIALSALDAASGAWICDSYADAAFENYLRDNNSYIALRTLLDSEKNGVECERFDFLYIYSGNGTEGALYNAGYGAGRKYFSDAVAAVKTNEKPQKSLLEIIESEGSNAERELARLFGK